MPVSPSTRRAVPLLVGALLFVAAGVVIAMAFLPRDSLGPMVQQVTSDGFRVVLYADEREPATIEVLDADGSVVTRQSIPPSNRTILARVDNLQPGRSYEYELRSGDENREDAVLGKGTVRTAPADGEAFRFLAFGDSGIGEGEQYSLATLMPDYEPHLIVHTGDLVYPSGDPADYPDNFFTPYAELIANVPFYPVIGNHDYRRNRGQSLIDFFVMPENGPDNATLERHYWFDYAGVRFVAIDTDPPFSELEATVPPWLDRVLADSADGWQVVYFHHPPYTAAKHSPAGKVRELLVPFFDKHDVDLVLCGHNHLYERTHPIRGGEVVPDGRGTVYVTTGAGGGELYPAQKPTPDYMAFQEDSRHSFTVVDVNQERMLLKQVGIDGRVIDTYEILPSSPPGQSVEDSAASRPTTNPAPDGRLS